MKTSACLVLVAALICGFSTGAQAFPGPRDGGAGIVIWFFLAYCALIVVAQLLAALHELRRLIERALGRKKASRQQFLR